MVQSDLGETQSKHTENLQCEGGGKNMAWWVLEEGGELPGGGDTTLIFKGPVGVI